MLTVKLTDAETQFPSLVDKASAGEVVTITRHGRPVAALVSVEAAELVCRPQARTRPGLVSYLARFPGGDVDRNSAPSGDADL